MSQGFGQVDADQIKVQIVVKRLKPAIARQDKYAVRNGLKECDKKYGEKVVAEAFKELMEDRWFIATVLDMVPEDSQRRIADEGYAVIAKVIEDAGGKLGFDFKVSDQGFLLSPVAVKAIKAIGYPNGHELSASTVEQIAEMGLSRPFFHPLSDVSQYDFGKGSEPTINLWGAASMIINAAMGWDEDLTEPTSQAVEILKTLVAKVAPNVGLDELMWRAQYDDRHLMKLCGYIQQGFQQEADKAFSRS